MGRIGYVLALLGLMMGQVVAQTTAWNPVSAPRYPSPNMYRPSVDGLTVRGTQGFVCASGGNCDMSLFKATPDNTQAANTLAYLFGTTNASISSINTLLSSLQTTVTSTSTQTATNTSGISTLNGQVSSINTALAGKAAAGANTDITSLNGPALGAATATTPAPGDNSTRVATTASVQAALGSLTVAPVGQVQLTFSSSTTLLLCPRGGNRLYVGGTNRTLAACQNISNTGLASGTLYYIYEYWNGTTLVPEFSTTNHAYDASTGLELKAGDTSRTLVGMVYTLGGSPGTFADNPAQRLVASWFNPLPRPLKGTTSGSSTASASAVLLSTGQRVQWVSWAGEAINLSLMGSVYGSAVGVSTNSYLYVDAAVAGVGSQFMSGSNGSGSVTIGPAVDSASISPVEGFHYADAYGSAYGGTGSWTSNIVGGVVH